MMEEQKLNPCKRCGGQPHRLHEGVLFTVYHCGEAVEAFSPFVAEDGWNSRNPVTDAAQPDGIGR